MKSDCVDREKEPHTRLGVARFNISSADDTVDRPSRHCLIAVAVGAAVVAVDQAGKFVTRSSGCGRVVCASTNDALFLSIPGASALVVLAIGSIGLAVCHQWLRAAGRRNVNISPVASGLLVSGIVANLLDRALLGAVRDFVLLPGRVVVNVADVAIVVGLIMGQSTMVRTSRARARNRKGGDER